MNVTRWCSGCAADVELDRVDCADHPEDCIELVCVLCGAGFELALTQGAAGRSADGRVTPAA